MSTIIKDPVTPSREDMQIAKASSRRLARFLNQRLRVSIAETEEQIELPAAAVRLLIDLLSAMAEGKTTTLIPIHAELTTQQAADLIGVSRPFLIKQLSEGKIRHRRVGTHRRIAFSDLMDYKHEMDDAGEKALEELARIAQEHEMGY